MAKPRMPLSPLRLRILDVLATGVNMTPAAMIQADPQLDVDSLHVTLDRMLELRLVAAAKGKAGLMRGHVPRYFSVTPHGRLAASISHRINTILAEFK